MGTPRVLLICGSLDAGRDGVGDYSSRLAEALVSAGAGVALASLSDPGVESATELGAPGAVPTLRLPRDGWRDPTQLDVLRRWGPTRAADWISLQFVPWSYDARGLPRRLPTTLRSLSRTARWHLMCHELWLERHHGPRHRALGVLQRRSIGALHRTLAPEVVHVTLQRNRRLLETQGIGSTVLPLFGNIAPESEAPRTAPDAAPDAAGPTRITFFGSPPPADTVDTVLGELRDTVASWPRDVEVGVVGGAEGPRRQLVARLSAVLRGLPAGVVDHGFLTAAEVSAVLSTTDVGVVRNRGDMVGKSGSALALLEHGAALWAPLWGDEPLDLDFRSERVRARLRDALALPRTATRSARAEVAARLLRDLAAAGAAPA